MLILRIIEDKNEKRRFFKKKRKKARQLNYTSFIIGTTIFYVLELYEYEVYSEEMQTILNKFKGYVLECENPEINKYLNAYLFDITPYVKRGLLSALNIFLQSNCSEESVFVNDNNFRFTSEWVNLAKKCKSLFINGSVNSEIKRFKSYCLSEYGINIFINEAPFGNTKTVSFDLNRIESNNSLKVECNNQIYIIKPDNKYFTSDEKVERLTEFGVSLESACAAIEKIPCRTNYIKPL